MHYHITMSDLKTVQNRRERSEITDLKDRYCNSEGKKSQHETILICSRVRLVVMMKII